jgi:hypothetical protein
MLFVFDSTDLRALKARLPPGGKERVDEDTLPLLGQCGLVEKDIRRLAVSRPADAGDRSLGRRGPR